ncbi:MAG TPA: hypothetical protein DIC53_11655 [Synergistaceae bacterium]|jgi:predicted DNA-binding transcriptional regulator AlpA|nr:hypothetical protein [Synergistaceae bacterium]
MQAPFVVLDSSLVEKVDELKREISEIKKLIVNFTPQERPTRRLRLPEVLDRMGISKTTWWDGIKAGRYPAGLKDRGVRVWREDEIDELIRMD